MHKLTPAPSQALRVYDDSNAMQQMSEQVCECRMSHPQCSRCISRCVNVEIVCHRAVSREDMATKRV